MTRTIPEWIAKHDDEAIPPRVKERISRRSNDKCKACGRGAGPFLPARFDHVTPLIIGGENRESNLQLLCEPCHAAKTKLDVKIKAKVARVRKRQLGIKKPSRFACSKSSKWKKKISGEVVAR